MRGNVVDLAVAVIIGGAFGKIVGSFVNDILMPPLGIMLGGMDFTDLKITLKDAATNAAGEAIPAVTLNWGNFVQVTVDFIIVAFAIFLLIKGINAVKKKEEEAPAPAAPPAPSREEVLLTEIRDLLKNK